MLFINYCVMGQTPVLNWSCILDGTKNVKITALETDSKNDIVIVGNFTGTISQKIDGRDIPYTSKGLDDFFIQKYSENGELIWIKTFGGEIDDYCYDVAIDNNDDIYIVGSFDKTVDFDPGEGTSFEMHTRNNIGYIAKYSVDGIFKWVKTLMPTPAIPYGNTVNSIEIDNNNNLLLTGYYQDETDFDPGDNTYYFEEPLSVDCFLLKLNSEGNFILARSFTSPNYVIGHSVRTDKNDNIYVLGSFSAETDFDPGSAVYKLTPENNYTVFLVKLDHAGNFKWALQPGGTIDYKMEGSVPIVADNNENIYLLRRFNAEFNFHNYTEIVTFNSNGSEDLFLQKIDSLGNFSWVKHIGGTGSDMEGNIAINGLGHICITASYENTIDCDPGDNVLELNSESDWGGAFFYAEFNTNGELIEAMNLPQKNDPWLEIYDLTINQSGHAVIAGQFYGDIFFQTNQNTSIVASSNDYYQSFLVDISKESLNSNHLIASNYHFFPNPVKETLYIKSKNQLKQAQIKVFDTFGRKLIDENFINGHLIPLDLKELKSGLYIISLYQENEQYSYRIIKQ